MTYLQADAGLAWYVHISHRLQKAIVNVANVFLIYMLMMVF